MPARSSSNRSTRFFVSRDAGQREAFVGFPPDVFVASVVDDKLESRF
jgi:hypothetical protein